VERVLKRILRALLVTLAMLTLVGGGVAVPADVWVVREDGVGPVKIGRSLSPLNAALHEKFAMPENKDHQPCLYVTSTRHPVVSFMIVDGVVERADVDAAGVSTVDGIQVGDSKHRHDGSTELEGRLSRISIQARKATI
jgi:hypothetical protein